MSYKFNVKPEECKYYIDEEKRKIVCVIDHTENMFINFADHNFVLTADCVDNIWRDSRRTRLYDQLKMPSRFWGIATCNPEDEWNEETGKLIAYSQAKDKLNKSFFKRANRYVDTLDKHLNNSVAILNKLGDRLEVSTERRHKKISDIIGVPETNGVS